MIDVAKLRIAGKINGRPVIYQHHLQFYCDHGYVPDRVGTTTEGVLFDMDYGPPITSATAVEGCRYFKRMSDGDPRVMNQHIPEDVRRSVQDFFRVHGMFVPIGEVVADKATGVVRLRRFVIERMVRDEVLCYDGACFRLTYPAT